MYAGWSCTLVSLSMYASGDSENRTVGLSTKQSLWVSQSRVKPGHFKSQNTQTGVKSFQFTECNVPHRSVTAWWNIPQYSSIFHQVEYCSVCLLFFLTWVCRRWRWRVSPAAGRRTPGAGGPRSGTPAGCQSPRAPAASPPADPWSAPTAQQDRGSASF